MKSFLQGKKSVPLTSLRAPGAVPAGFAPQLHAHSAGSGTTPGASSANVEVVKEGDKIVRLVVTCVCGERVEIECLYAAGS